MGVYTLQFSTFIFTGEKPESIKALGHLNQDGVDLSMSATLKFKGNRIATILTNSEVDLPNEALIIGTKGTIKIPKFWCPTRAELPNREIEITLPKGEHEFNFLNSAGLSFEASEVRSCLLKGSFLLLNVSSIIFLNFILYFFSPISVSVLIFDRKY